MSRSCAHSLTHEHIQYTCVQTDALFTFIWMQQCVAYVRTHEPMHTQACTHAWYPLITHTGLCGAWAHFIVGCCPCAGLPKQSSSQETQWITPDTSVFSINCHPWHSALSIHRAQFLHSKFLSRSKVCPVSDFYCPAHKLWVLFQCMPYLLYSETPDDSKIK